MGLRLDIRPEEISSIIKNQIKKLFLGTSEREVPRGKENAIESSSSSLGRRKRRNLHPLSHTTMYHSIMELLQLLCDVWC